ncbi:putative transcriptional regulator protein, ROK family [uncultured Pleomorphomonas sp.]|uniref:Putative transcriptional regulator protein, ROK family n=1 Tax=uncultured Pleomorphomonas sp. TaxID=442121 RepID=A0A212LDX8_9HYPH|nr:ROK family protein [uncultured Pleomorphomonas sp.]SCM75710.1 putative transcriptional regulator protein, ROK family [uncultured Pleomorphomonas sp.]
MPSLKGNQSTSRTLNRLLLLNHLRRHGPTARSDIAAATGLSPAAISYVSSELLEQQVIAELDAVADGGRRRMTRLDLNYAGHVALGVKLMERSLRATLVDLGTNVIDTLTADVDARSPAAVARATADALADLLERSGERRQRLIGIGLAMPGQHDAERGVCLRCDRFGWKDVPIAALIADLAGVPVWVDNDVNAFALAEHLFGAGRQASSLAVFSFGRGIGAAMIVDGQLLRGRYGGAGEIGHLTVVEGGPRCECGRLGCLEAVTSLPAILNAYGIVRPSDRSIDPAALAALAGEGDPVAREILDTAGRRLGAAAATFASLFDPETMVIGGEGVLFGPALLDPLVATLKEKNFQRNTEVFVEFWNDDAWARGAAALAIDSFFSLPS